MALGADILGTRPVLELKGRVCRERKRCIVKDNVCYLVFGIWAVGLYTLHQLNTKWKVGLIVRVDQSISRSTQQFG